MGATNITSAPCPCAQISKLQNVFPNCQNVYRSTASDNCRIYSVNNKVGLLVARDNQRRTGWYLGYGVPYVHLSVLVTIKERDLSFVVKMLQRHIVEDDPFVHRRIVTTEEIHVSREQAIRQESLR